MRAFLAGLFFSLLLLGLPPAAWGQIDTRGSAVESIGFQRAYRPDAWVPMVVRLKSTLGDPAEYQIQVVQPDIDGDHVIYSRLVTLNAMQTEKYWVYFRPRATGLDVSSLQDLNRAIRVRVCTRDGKMLAPLPLTDMPVDFDPKMGFSIKPGKKMILAVIGGTRSRPAELDYESSIGVIEQVDFVRVTPADLPENALGYDMVDGMVWFGPDAAELTRAGSRKLAALQEWVRQGGHLVVCQPEEPYRIQPFADMLPVLYKGADDKWLVEVLDKKEPEPLHRIAVEPTRRLTDLQRGNDNWHLIPGPFRIARAVPREDVVVDEWVQWDKEQGGGRSPFLARNAYGLGAVTWVAQDLGDEKIIGNTSSGWPHVWDRVFGWRNSTIVRRGNLQDPTARRDVWGQLEEDWTAGSVADLGGVFLKATDHQGKAGAYVFLVILFFVGYWIVAGPGSYLFLAGKGQRQMSWAVFAASGLAATVLTVLVVKLILRGDAEVRHLSVVRLAAGQPAVIDSRVGLYIPRDGNQRVVLKDVAPEALSYVTPLAVHPQHLINVTEFSDTASYEVPVRDVSGADEPVQVVIPYRSTLKKLQAHWVGNTSEVIDGSPELAEAPTYLAGILTNKTGRELKNVFFAFNFKSGASGTDRDIVLYVPVWKKGEALDLAKQMLNGENVTDAAYDKLIRGGGGPTWGFLDTMWGERLHRYIKGVVSSDGRVDDSESAVKQSLLLMTVFDRVPPMKNVPYGGFNRAELLRRGARQMNMSHLVGAGNLVILAEATNEPLPFPMEVEGERMTGEGTVIYQATLPIKNRTKLHEQVPQEDEDPDAPNAEKQANGTAQPASAEGEPAQGPTSEPVEVEAGSPQPPAAAQ